MHGRQGRRGRRREKITRCSCCAAPAAANIVDPVRRGGDGADPVVDMVAATTDEHTRLRREILLDALHHAALVLGEEHHAAQGRKRRG